MSTKSERTAWAEGLGFDEFMIEDLTEIMEEATRRARHDDRRRADPLLPANDIWSAWPSELEAFGYDDLAERVRELDPT